MNDFKPKTLVFCCNWCSYAGADLAGTSRLQMKPYSQIIRTMCSARIDPTFILYAFAQGVDGVLVAGCHPGDCHYLSGNYKTLRRVTLLKNMLQQMGIETDMLRLEWISASEASKFQNTVNEFIDKITELGPLNGKKLESLAARH